MSDVQMWQPIGDRFLMEEMDDGDYVMYEDHAKIVAELKDKLYDEFMAGWKAGYANGSDND